MAEQASPSPNDEPSKVREPSSLRRAFKRVVEYRDRAWREGLESAQSVRVGFARTGWSFFAVFAFLMAEVIVFTFLYGYHEQNPAILSTSLLVSLYAGIGTLSLAFAAVASLYVTVRTRSEETAPHLRIRPISIEQQVDHAKLQVETLRSPIRFGEEFDLTDASKTRIEVENLGPGVARRVRVRVFLTRTDPDVPNGEKTEYGGPDWAERGWALVAPIMDRHETELIPAVWYIPEDFSDLESIGVQATCDDISDSFGDLVEIGFEREGHPHVWITLSPGQSELAGDEARRRVRRRKRRRQSE